MSKLFSSLASSRFRGDEAGNACLCQISLSLQKDLPSAFIISCSLKRGKGNKGGINSQSGGYIEIRGKFIQSM